jgi:HD-GYP domain-containing protein (c-di-GMP phosphodiesterase class II)
MGIRPPHHEERWRSRRFSAAIVRLLIFVAPIAAGFVVGSLVAPALPEPSTVYEIAFWWVAIISVATVTATATDRLARQFLPLAVLLRMTMLFPDAAPSRLRTARRVGNVSELRRRIVEAGTDEGSKDLANMAELILSLSTALSHHDRKTRGHSERTRAYTDLIAAEMGLPERDRDRLRWAALLHDVGKLDVPTEILNKNGSLDDDEWEVVKQHPLLGMRLVSPLIPWLGEWAETIEHHHERFDGSGYPHGLAGEDISLGARIVSVADAYDVMTSGRSYQKAMTPVAARTEIAALAGVQFDPVVARALMTVSLGKLRWSTGPIAAVAQMPFVRGIPQVGRDLAVVLTTSAMVTSGFIAGAIPTPTGIGVPPAEVIEVVIAGADLHNRQAPAGQDGFPIAAEDTSGSVSDDRFLDDPSNAESFEGAGPGVGATPTTTPTGTTTPTTPPPTTTTTTSPTTTTTVPVTTTTTPPPPASSVTATDDSAVSATGGSINFSILANDQGPIDGSSVSVGSVTGGSVTTLGSSGRIRFDAEPGFTGTTSFTYTVCATDGSCASATVTIDVG